MFNAFQLILYTSHVFDTVLPLPEQILYTSQVFDTVFSLPEQSMVTHNYDDSGYFEKKYN